MTMDNIHLTVLREILVELDKTDTPESEVQELNSVWHRLDPWPDTVEGLTLLRQDRVVGALSNGNLMMLIDNAKHSGLPWDVVLSTDMIGTSKPNPAVYEGAARLLGMPPDEIMMVAAHAYDVDGAKATGMRTAYVHRPDEHGPGHGDDHGDLSRFDIVADSFTDLHRKLNS
jgi:2-haloacid dehalogenase